MPTFDSNIVPTVNIFLGAAGFFWLLLRTTRRWREYPYEVKLLLVATLLFIVALLETSAEQLADGVNFSFNSFVIFFVKVFLLVVLWLTRGTLYRTGHREGVGGRDETNVNREIPS